MWKSSHGYSLVWERGRKYEHQHIVESVLGKELPKQARIHHVDGDRSNNNKSNLVVCPNVSYHFDLHRRTRALKATGDANKVFCSWCKQWKDRKEMVGKRKHGHCKSCHAYRQAERKAKK